jgi:hypothetical protein
VITVVVRPDPEPSGAEYVTTQDAEAETDQDIQPRPLNPLHVGVLETVYCAGLSRHDVDNLGARQKWRDVHRIQWIIGGPETPSVESLEQREEKVAPVPPPGLQATFGSGRGRCGIPDDHHDPPDAGLRHHPERPLNPRRLDHGVDQHPDTERNLGAG